MTDTPAKRFQGSADGGAAGRTSSTAQVTEAELKTMTPEQIVKAQAEGRLADILSGPRHLTQPPKGKGS